MKNRGLRNKIISVIMAAVVMLGTSYVNIVPAEEAMEEPAASSEEELENSQESKTELDETASFDAQAPEIPGLTFESEMKLEYAQKFKVFYYSDGYKVLDINDGTLYLVVPEGKETPENLDKDMFGAMGAHSDMRAPICIPEDEIYF